MKFRISLIIIFVLSAAGNAVAANSDTMTIYYEVQAINEVNVDASTVTLAVFSATAGAQPDYATSDTTYDITTNCAVNAKKMTAVINSDMPSGLTLEITAAAPTGASSEGYKSLSSSAADIVTGIDANATADISMTIRLSASVAAGVVAQAPRTLTVTLTDSN